MRSVSSKFLVCGLMGVPLLAQAQLVRSARMVVPSARKASVRSFAVTKSHFTQSYLDGNIGLSLLERLEAQPLVLSEQVSTTTGLSAVAWYELFKSPLPHHKSNVFPGKEKIDAVIFDLDGTLLDSLGAWEHSGSNFLRTQGIEPSPQLDAELEKLSLMDGARLLKERYQLSYSPEEILEYTLRPIRERYYTTIQPVPGVPELLMWLKTQGIKMVVATASDRQLAVAALYRLGLLDYFEFILTCDEVHAGKATPAVYEEALRRLGTSKARTLVAEDALHALQTAHQAGFPTVAIEERHSAAQRSQKMRVADYYIWPRGVVQRP